VLVDLITAKSSDLRFEIEELRSRINPGACGADAPKRAIVKNRQDACSTKSEFACGGAGEPARDLNSGCIGIITNRS